MFLPRMVRLRRVSKDRICTNITWVEQRICPVDDPPLDLRTRHIACAGRGRAPNEPMTRHRTAPCRYSCPGAGKRNSGPTVANDFPRLVRERHHPGGCHPISRDAWDHL